MLFDNLKVERLIVHEILKRLDRTPVDPVLSENLENLDAEAHEVFCKRIASALSSTRCVEMALLKSTEDSVFAVTQALLRAVETKDFIQNSQAVAACLAIAQSSVNIPGGLLMVFSGTVGVPEKRYIGYLKAEPQSGFRKSEHNGLSMLEYIKQLFLTPDAKVYKIGLFILDEPDKCQQPGGEGFNFFLYDANIANKETAKAAIYFYEGFLGLTYSSTDAKLARTFILGTREFIAKSDFSEEKKMDYRSALVTYMRTEQSNLASVADFGEKYFDDAETRDAFIQFAEVHRMPSQAFSKDISESTALLRRRKVRFGGDIQLSAPADKFSEKITVKEVPQEDGTVWSHILIRDKLLGE